MSEFFTRADFLDVFARYNTAIGRAPWALVTLALLGPAAIVRDWRHRDKWCAGVLAALWLWSGVAYHWSFFADVNPAAILFGASFIGQAWAFVHFGIRRKDLTFAKPAKDARSVAGIVVMAYAVVGYPIASVASGHSWPSMPTFGAPCQVTLFTFGLLLWAKRPVPRVILYVPAGWAVLASVAAFDFGMHEDWGLLVSAAAAVSWLWGRRREEGPAPLISRTGKTIPGRIQRHARER